MTGRALVFSNPDVIAALKADFVPYAGDKWYLNRQNDGDGAFFVRAAQQIPGRKVEAGDKGRAATAPQGLYAVLPDGTLLAYDHFRPSPRSVLDLLKRATEKAKAAPAAGAVGGTAAASPSAPDPNYTRQPPPGGLILNVFARIPLPAPPGQEWTPNQATGRDHLWITREEWRAFRPPVWRNGARHPLPASVAGRIARFHLIDTVRGEPGFWDRKDVQASEMTLVVEDTAAGRLRLEGNARLSSGAAHGYDARIQGYVTFDRARERITRLDWLAWGEAWGESNFTPGAPSGRFPLLIAASLAGDSAGDRVPPQGLKSWDYGATGRPTP